MMDFWFTTSHGNTCHNQPGTPNYIDGEQPRFPLTAINYREKCLNEGFARIGYPNTGDLNNEGYGRLAINGYSLSNISEISNSQLTRKQLMDFATIKAGDFIFIPADEDLYQVHFGMVLTRDKSRISPHITPRPNAYYFYYNIAEGDFYECAHRVNVQWAKENNGEFAKPFVPQIGGRWRQAFGHIHEVDETLLILVKKYGYW